MSSQLKSAINFCRLCANNIEDTGQKDLFNENNKCMLEQVKELTGLTLKNMPRQTLPIFFCGDCQAELPRACEFRRKIIKTQSYFKSREYKNKLKELKKSKTSVTVAPRRKITSNLDETKPTFDALERSDREIDNATTMEYFETSIKDETRDSTSVSNDESPIELNATNQITSNIREKSLKPNLKTVIKTSHTTDNASQKFDAVFLPLKKEDNELNKLSDNESDKDELEDFTADESEDPDFEIEFNAKNEYNEKPPTRSKHIIKEEATKDPRKNPLFCYICSTTLKTLHAFKVHCRKLHKGEKIFKCDSCEETFLRIKSLIRHNRIHIGGKLFECRYCDMSFNAPTTRIHHERAKHTKDWPFLCPICGKSFITTTRGKEHMTVHTKERPYKCELCKTAYLQRNNFKKHRRSELHKNNEKKLKESMENVSNENATEDKNKSDLAE